MPNQSAHGIVVNSVIQASFDGFSADRWRIDSIETVDVGGTDARRFTLSSVPGGAETHTITVPASRVFSRV